MFFPEMMLPLFKRSADGELMLRLPAAAITLPPIPCCSLMFPDVVPDIAPAPLLLRSFRVFCER